MKNEKRLITAALPYTNNVPHIGNIVGSHLPADIFARYCRLIGHDTVFIGGTDEHGTASEIAAHKYGITPKQLCNFFYKIHKNIYDWFGISYDNFSQTSRTIHHKTTQEFLKKVYKNGFITEKSLALPFCLDCKRQLSDRYIEGKCPYCGYEKARGDQCESCSKLLDPVRLKKPYCAVCGSSRIEFKEIKHLFFELGKLSKRLEKWIKANKQWRQQVKAIALSWIKEGLKARCITRDLKWGIKVPFKGYEHFIFYVWVDAPIGYISSTKEWNKNRWKEFWQKKDARIYHFVGKDNIPFHTIFFPGMLMANGDYNLPYNVVGLQYLNYEGSKFSKSKEHGVFCENLPKSGLDADYWRFYLSFLIPELKDTEFFWKEFQERINTELVGNLGNFFNRTLSFVQNKFNGKIPKPRLNAKDKAFIRQAEKQAGIFVRKMEEVRLRESLEALLRLSAMGNKYFQDNEPWKDMERAKAVMYVCSNVCCLLGMLMEPFLPSTSKKALNMLNVKPGKWINLGFRLQAGHKIRKPELLFRKLESKQVEELKEKTSKVTEFFKEKIKKKAPIDKLKRGPLEERSMMEKEKEHKAKKAEKGVEQLKTHGHYVPIADFKKLDIRVGKVVKIEPHPDAEKLYVMLVDLGFGENDRQIVAGLKQHYEMDKLLGKKIIMVTNLQPVSIRGIESNGMLLAAVDEGNVSLLTVDRDVKEGAKIE